MNTGRLLSFIDFLLEKEKQFQVQGALTGLQTAMDNLTNQPQSPDAQNAVSKSFALLKEKLGGLASAMSPAQIDMLDDLAGGEMMGPSLGNRVTEWISANAMTPAVARDQIAKTSKRRNALLTTLTETSQRLKTLGIAPEEPPIGQVELGFLIPREIFENDFDRFREELKFLSLTVSLYSEATTGEIEPITIGEISSSDPLLFLGIGIPTVLAISGTIKWLLDSLKTSLEIREILNRGKAVGLSEDAMRGISTEINARLENAIEERVKIVLKDYQDSERKNELSNGLTIVTRELLGRIERGMKVEIRLGEIPETSSEEATDSSTTKLAELDALSQELVFPRLTGDALIQIGAPQAQDVLKSTK